MKITRVIVRFGITGNLGNYNSVQSSLEYGIEFEPGEDPTEVVTKFQAMAQDEVFTEIRSVKGPKKSKAQNGNEDLL